MIRKAISGVLAIICLFFFYKGFYQYYQGNRSDNWPSTQGVVFVSESRRPASSGAEKAYIKYRYSVGNTSYESDFIHFPEFNPANLVYRFKKDTQVQVHYNPEDPSEAVLIPGASLKSILLFMAMGAAFLVFSLLIMFVKFSFVKNEDV